MTDERLRRTQELFERAVELDVVQRSEFLENACGNDPTLRAEVESLIDHHEDLSKDFLEVASSGRLPLDRAAHEADDRLLGQRVGQCRVESVLGSGGMGTVYRALQERPRRAVALKVLRLGIYSQAAARRFEYESQLLGSLVHPGVAHIYETGAADEQGGMPFFAMELVPSAMPITEYAASSGLTLRDRLALFLQVCEAVHYAHQKGIIHRDLKPGNILVNAAGHVKVIDFGVARATDADVALATQTDAGKLVGTLQYMSPEQCDADPHALDVRSDVYSLGVVLYELLCGEPPYDTSGTSVYRAARVIKEQVPPKPSSLSRAVRGDIETIVLKSLEKNAGARYQSVAELIDEIQRFLRGEPIEARPPTPWSRVVRWSIGHPIITTAAACVSIAILTITATWIGLWVLAGRPHRAEILRDGREVRILTVAGDRFGGIESNQASAFRFGIVNDRPAEFGGGRLLLIGFGAAADVPFPRALCAFQAQRDFLDRLVWTRQINTEELPPGVGGNGGLRGEDFNFDSAYVFDIFPSADHPGDEIVAIFYPALDSDVSVARIYDLAGRNLYEVWHKGTLPDCYWLPAPRLLLFLGQDSSRSWRNLGHPDMDKEFPYVVLAVHPEPGGSAMSLPKLAAQLERAGIPWRR